MSTSPRLLVTVTVVLASVAYLGSVPPRALVVFVLPASLIGAVVATAARRLGAGLLTVLVASGAWSVVVNVLSGTTQGPAARSSAFAGLFSGLAVLALGTSMPALFLLPVSLVLGGALGLGAGAEVWPVALMVAVAAVPALASVERERRRWTAAPRTAGLLGLGLLVALLGGGVALVLQPPRTPLVLFPGQTDPAVNARLPELAQILDPGPTIRPGAAPSGRPSRRPSTAGSLPSVLATPQPSRPAEPRSLTPTSRLLVALQLAPALLLVLLAAVLLRVVFVGVAWRRLRRHLDDGTPAQRVVGAWTWLSLRLPRSGVTLPPSWSPDIAADETQLPVPQSQKAVHALAAQASMAAFSNLHVTTDTASTSWDLADEVDRVVSSAATRTVRLRALTRWPPRRPACG